MLTGEKGLMTHILPSVMDAVRPWLKNNVKDERFWNGEYDVTHIGEYEISEPTKEDRKIFFERFARAMYNA